jgi:hypothetical protein
MNRAGYLSRFITLFNLYEIAPHPTPHGWQMQFSSANRFAAFSSKALIPILLLDSCIVPF